MTEWGSLLEKMAENTKGMKSQLEEELSWLSWFEGGGAGATGRSEVEESRDRTWSMVQRPHRVC